MAMPPILKRWLARLFPAKTLGQRGEAAAARYLRRRGYKILARGSRIGPGELDLVMLDRKTIVFVEVKTRAGRSAGSPEEAVTASKQQRLVRLAHAYLAHRSGEIPACRFDVIAVESGRMLLRVRHLQAAFRADGLL